ncbi:MAG: hypothetical protein HY000_33145 [Planctomycetes bacterium]|nr:hypothetical protein [Planctomycetota bacterium]
MTAPRYSESELWQKVRSMCETKHPFFSGKRGNKYVVDSVDEAAKEYSVRYESGNLKRIPLRDLYAVYVELYELGSMPRDYLKDPANGERLVGHTRYSHAPGATLFAILPALDDRIQAGEGGRLSLSPA